MTLVKKLEELANACDACADKDEGSLNDHFENCPACKEHAEMAEKLNQMIETFQMMAGKPEETRHKILSARIENFTSLPDDKRFEAISGMLDSLAMLSERDRNAIVKTRTNILTKIPKAKRKILMGTMKKIMAGWDDDRKMMEKRAVMAATEDYFLLKKVMVRMMFKKLMA